MRRGEGDLGVVGWGDFTLITMNRTKKALRTISVSLSSIYVLCSVSSLLVLVRCKWHKAGRFKLKARPVGEKMSDISLSFFFTDGPLFSFLSSYFSPFFFFSFLISIQKYLIFTAKNECQRIYLRKSERIQSTFMYLIDF